MIVDMENGMPNEVVGLKCLQCMISFSQQDHMMRDQKDIDRLGHHP